MLYLSDLSPGEKLQIDRRRAGRSQREAAAKHGVRLYTYRAWEDDRANGSPSVALGRLHPWERCYLLRVRADILLKDAPRKMGFTRWWLCQMEYGRAPTTALLQYWGRRAVARKRKTAS